MVEETGFNEERLKSNLAMIEEVVKHHGLEEAERFVMQKLDEAKKNFDGSNLQGVKASYLADYKHLNKTWDDYQARLQKEREAVARPEGLEAVALGDEPAPTVDPDLVARAVASGGGQSGSPKRENRPSIAEVERSNYSAKRFAKYGLLGLAGIAVSGGLLGSTYVIIQKNQDIAELKRQVGEVDEFYGLIGELLSQNTEDPVPKEKEKLKEAVRSTVRQLKDGRKLADEAYGLWKKGRMQKSVYTMRRAGQFSRRYAGEALELEKKLVAEYSKWDTIYNVQAGDTLDSISREYNFPSEWVRKVNEPKYPFLEKEDVVAGMQILVPQKK